MKETEAALIIYSEKPQEIADKIGKLDLVDGYLLVTKGVLHIEDVYFDTARQELNQKELALRIRTFNGEHLITLKGPSKETGDKNVIERLEIEEKWSKSSLDKMTGMLKKYGVIIAKDNYFEENSPIETLEKLGLVILQKRSTKRIVKNIEKRNQLVAELDIDEVSYHFGSKTIQIFQIEIETKKDDNKDVINIISNLNNIFGTKLKAWNYGKIVTGNVIQKLSEQGLKELVKDNIIVPSGYDMIENELNKP